MSKEINQELKNKILNSVRNEGVSVIKASKEYGISTITIYKWLKKTQSEEPGKANSLQEIKRLKKDKEDLLLIIGEMQAELSRIKKRNKNIKKMETQICKSFNEKIPKHK